MKLVLQFEVCGSIIPFLFQDYAAEGNHWRVVPTGLENIPSSSSYFLLMPLAQAIEFFHLTLRRNKME
jgi:hypothetical protein